MNPAEKPAMINLRVVRDIMGSISFKGTQRTGSGFFDGYYTNNNIITSELKLLDVRN